MFKDLTMYLLTYFQPKTVGDTSTVNAKGDIKRWRMRLQILMRKGRRKISIYKVSVNLLQNNFSINL